jgi:hypothetical protein
MRFLAIAEDAADPKRPKWARLSDMLCRLQSGYPYYWEDGKP